MPGEAIRKLPKKMWTMFVFFGVPIWNKGVFEGQKSKLQEKSSCHNFYCLLMDEIMLQTMHYKRNVLWRGHRRTDLSRMSWDVASPTQSNLVCLIKPLIFVSKITKDLMDKNKAISGRISWTRFQGKTLEDLMDKVTRDLMDKVAKDLMDKVTKDLIDKVRAKPLESQELSRSTVHSPPIRHVCKYKDVRYWVYIAFVREDNWYLYDFPM